MMLPLLMVAALLQNERPDPVCSAEIRWAVDGPQTMSRAVPQRTFGLFSAVGRAGSGTCLPAEIQLTVTYFDTNDEVVCSGVIASIATVQDHAQMTLLELKPTNLFELVRWRNHPREPVRPVRLPCVNPDGTALIQPGEIDRAASVRVDASILPRYGGVATSELRLAILP